LLAAIDTMQLPATDAGGSCATGGCSGCAVK
jgi:hypothetical protein